MIQPGLAISAKADFLSGRHQLGDRYRFALYEAEADLSEETTAYTPEGEVVGMGYRAGGQEIVGWGVSAEGSRLFISFEDLVWPRSTITARGGLIYNDSRPGGPTVAVVSFGRDVISTNGPFTVALPAGSILMFE